ncbi:MAG: ATP-binding protein [Lachnospiraceae bacterium]|nr:ATP-binding protein [Lachnospiraceae bacterium]
MIKRERYMIQIRDFMDRPVVKVLTGMRRSGKSAMLELIKEELTERGISKNNVIHINFESLRYEKLKEYHALYEEISRRTEELQGKVYILLDEIQEVTGWEQAINSFRVDFDCDIYVTGSNARLMSGELATLLAGRYVEIRIYPLDFQEYLEFAKENPEEAELSRQEHFANYLRYGGLPGIHQMKWEESRIMQYLTDIYNSVLLKDVIARNGIRDTALLESIIHYLMDNVGKTFSAKTISDFLKNQGRKLSTETVYNYLNALECAFLIHKAARFDIKGKRILETQEKYYLSDLGLRHAVLGYRQNDIADLLENVVYLELLRRGYTVAIGKQDVAEVDFVADKGDDRLYIQVCYILTPENMDREFASLEAIRDNYEKVVLTMDTLLGVNRGGIRQKNLVEFLLK